MENHAHHDKRPRTLEPDRYEAVSEAFPKISELEPKGGKALVLVKRTRRRLSYSFSPFSRFSLQHVQAALQLSLFPIRLAAIGSFRTASFAYSLFKQSRVHSQMDEEAAEVAACALERSLAHPASREFIRQRHDTELRGLARAGVSFARLSAAIPHLGADPILAALLRRPLWTRALQGWEADGRVVSLEEIWGEVSEMCGKRVARGDVVASHNVVMPGIFDFIDFVDQFRDLQEEPKGLVAPEPVVELDADGDVIMLDLSAVNSVSPGRSMEAKEAFSFLAGCVLTALVMLEMGPRT